jgi:2-polyprenyl-3-methyl-5-hydroxy-6-metoxy-1,4-benzoquinol methylase
MNPHPVIAAVYSRYDGADYLEYELANDTAFLNLALLSLSDAGFFQIENELPPDKRRLLDVGCATGALLGYLSGRGWQADGVEINGAQAEYARRTRGLNIYQLPLEKNGFADNSYQIVTASHLIEHLRAPRAFLAEVRRVLSPGGRLFIITPNCDGFQARLFKARWRSAIFDHLYLFSAETLSRMLEQEGFTIEKTLFWGGLAAGVAPRPVKIIFDKLAKRFGFGDVMLIRALSS